jgi:hypothetical protein
LHSIFRPVNRKPGFMGRPKRFECSARLQAMPAARSVDAAAKGHSGRKHACLDIKCDAAETISSHGQRGRRSDDRQSEMWWLDERQFAVRTTVGDGSPKRCDGVCQTAVTPQGMQYRCRLRRRLSRRDRLPYTLEPGEPLTMCIRPGSDGGRYFLSTKDPIRNKPVDRNDSETDSGCEKTVAREILQQFFSMRGPRK